MGINDSYGMPSHSGSFGNYVFQLGKRPLKCDCFGCSAKYSGQKITHDCLKYGGVIFEYDRNGYKQSFDFDDFSWDDEIKGSSGLSPSELDDYIKNFGEFTGDKYSCCRSSIKEKNNCQDFVYFCLNKLNPRIAEKYRSKMFQECAD